ncbi:MAG: hypothetical protein ABR543_11255 [Gemmatimonadaceae bacterium]
MDVTPISRLLETAIVRAAVGVAAVCLSVAADVVLYSPPANAASSPTAIQRAPSGRKSVSAAQVMVSECARKQARDKHACYEKSLTDRLATSGLKGTLATLQAMAQLDQDVEREGHVFAHGIGIEAYRLTQNPDTMFAYCSAIFASGCYHGVIQAFLDDMSSIDGNSVNALCQAYKSDSRWLFFQCLHGMGHGLNMFYDHDLPRALTACDFIADRWERESCYGGAFMENIMHAIAPHHPASRLVARRHATHDQGATGTDSSIGSVRATGTHSFRPLDPTDPLYPCSIVAQKYLSACYLIQTSAILHLNGGDIAGAARSCDRAPRGSRPACYQSLGRDITAYAREDPDESNRLCSLGSERYQRWCYFGAAKSLIDWTARADPGFALCRKVAGSQSKLKCYEAVGEQIATLESVNSERAALCEKAENSESVDACRVGARLARTDGHVR